MPTEAKTEIQAVGAWLFWTRGEGKLSRLIARVIGRWTHMGIGFDLADGRQVYYEALFNEGFTGPKPWEKIPAWAKQHPRRGWSRRGLDLSQETSELKRRVCQAHVGHLGYGKLQLLAMWWFERVGKRYGWHVPRSPNRVVCSEVVSRILCPDITLTTRERSRHDEVTPTSAWETICLLQDGRLDPRFPGPQDALRGPRIDRGSRGGSTPAGKGDRRFAK